MDKQKKRKNRNLEEDIDKMLVDSRLLSFMVRRFGDSNVTIDEAETLLRSQLGVKKPAHDSGSAYKAWCQGHREKCILDMGKIFNDLANMKVGSHTNCK